MESHNRTIKLYREESRGGVQPAVVACPEIIDPAMLVVADAAGLRAISITLVYARPSYYFIFILASGG